MNMLVFPRIVCNDGFSMSVQARAFCYCSPRNGWVPIEVVNEVIAKRGGTNEDGAAVLNAIINGGAFLDRFKE